MTAWGDGKSWRSTRTRLLAESVIADPTQSTESAFGLHLKFSHRRYQWAEVLHGILTHIKLSIDVCRYSVALISRTCRRNVLTSQLNGRSVFKYELQRLLYV